MKLSKSIVKLGKIFNKNNFQIYLVGGAIRDYLLNGEISDYDFATDASPEQVLKIFPNVIPVGIEHGTVLVLFENNEYEITTFRKDGKYSDKRHPDDVIFIDRIDEDLKRRDFTINAFAYDINKNKLVDNFDGKKDLNHKIIKAIGNPEERFTEDALRMLRACRFSSQLNFEIENNTFNSIVKLAENIKNISAERIRDELIKIMLTDKPSIALEYMRKSGLMKYIIPELLEGYGIKQNRFHKYDVYYHNIYSCDAASKNNYIIRFAALFHDIAKPQTIKEKEDLENENSFYNHEIIGTKISYNFLKRMKFKNSDIKQITHLVKYHMFHYTIQWTDGAVRRFIRNVGIENLEDLFKLRDADRIGNGMKQGIPEILINFKDRIKKILEIDNAFKIKDMDIDGNTIKEKLNIGSGPIIGEILNYLLEIVLDNPILNKKEILIEKTLEYYSKKSEYSLKQYKNKPENLGKF